MTICAIILHLLGRQQRLRLQVAKHTVEHLQQQRRLRLEGFLCASKKTGLVQRRPFMSLTFEKMPWNTSSSMGASDLKDICTHSPYSPYYRVQ